MRYPNSFESKSNHPSTSIVSIQAWQQPQKQFLTKVIALLISISFNLQPLAWAFDKVTYQNSDQPIITYQSHELFVPDKFGVIRQAHQAGKQVVVHIQDLHCNYDVQMNIANIIDHFSRKHHLKLVGVEGSSAAVNTTKLGSFPIRQVKQDVGRTLVKQGQMNGAEYYAATGKNETILKGIEDEALYRHNLKTVHEFLNAESQGHCFDLRELLDETKATIYNRSLLRFDEHYTNYRDGRLSMLKYALLLKKYASQLQLDTGSYPNITIYIKKHQSTFPVALNIDDLYEELNQLNQAIRQAMYTEPSQRQLDQLLHRLDIIEKLINISATPEELAEFTSQRDQYKVKVFFEFIQRYLADADFLLDPELVRLDDYLEKVADFYEVADHRSEKFVNNILNNMQTYQQDIAILVSGGFHTEGIVKHLQNKNISYISVMPRILHKDIVNPYFQLLQNRKTPLERLLAQNQNLIQIPLKSVGVADQNREAIIYEPNLAEYALDQRPASLERYRTFMNLIQLMLNARLLQYLIKHEKLNNVVNEYFQIKSGNIAKPQAYPGFPAEYNGLEIDMQALTDATLNQLQQGQPAIIPVLKSDYSLVFGRAGALTDFADITEPLNFGDQLEYVVLTNEQVAFYGERLKHATAQQSVALLPGINLSPMVAGAMMTTAGGVLVQAGTRVNRFVQGLPNVTSMLPNLVSGLQPGAGGSALNNLSDTGRALLDRTISYTQKKWPIMIGTTVAVAGLALAIVGLVPVGAMVGVVVVGIGLIISQYIDLYKWSRQTIARAGNNTRALTRRTVVALSTVGIVAMQVIGNAAEAATKVLYTVAPGDWAGVIAKRLGVPLESLGLNDPNKIYPGDQLEVTTEKSLAAIQSDDLRRAAGEVEELSEPATAAVVDPAAGAEEVAGQVDGDALNEPLAAAAESAQSGAAIETGIETAAEAGAVVEESLTEIAATGIADAAEAGTDTLAVLPEVIADEPFINVMATTTELPLDGVFSFEPLFQIDGMVQMLNNWIDQLASLDFGGWLQSFLSAINDITNLPVLSDFSLDLVFDMGAVLPIILGAIILSRVAKLLLNTVVLKIQQLQGIALTSDERALIYDLSQKSSYRIVLYPNLPPRFGLNALRNIDFKQVLTAALKDQGVEQIAGQRVSILLKQRLPQRHIRQLIRAARSKLGDKVAFSIFYQDANKVIVYHSNEPALPTESGVNNDLAPSAVSASIQNREKIVSRLHYLKNVLAHIAHLKILVFTVLVTLFVGSWFILPDAFYPQLFQTIQTTLSEVTARAASLNYQTAYQDVVAALQANLWVAFSVLIALVVNYLYLRYSKTAGRTFLHRLVNSLGSLALALALTAGLGYGAYALSSWTFNEQRVETVESHQEIKETIAKYTEDRTFQAQDLPPSLQDWQGETYSLANQVVNPEQEKSWFNYWSSDAGPALGSLIKLYEQTKDPEVLERIKKISRFLIAEVTNWEGRIPLRQTYAPHPGVTSVDNGVAAAAWKPLLQAVELTRGYEIYPTGFLGLAPAVNGQLNPLQTPVVSDDAGLGMTLPHAAGSLKVSLPDNQAYFKIEHLSKKRPESLAYRFAVHGPGAPRLSNSLWIDGMISPIRVKDNPQPGTPWDVLPLIQKSQTAGQQDGTLVFYSFDQASVVHIPNIDKVEQLILHPAPMSNPTDREGSGTIFTSDGGNWWEGIEIVYASSAMASAPEGWQAPPVYGGVIEGNLYAEQQDLPALLVDHLDRWQAMIDDPAIAAYRAWVFDYADIEIGLRLGQTALLFQELGLNEQAEQAKSAALKLGQTINQKYMITRLRSDILETYAVGRFYGMMVDLFSVLHQLDPNPQWEAANAEELTIHGTWLDRALAVANNIEAGQYRHADSAKIEYDKISITRSKRRTEWRVGEQGFNYIRGRQGELQALTYLDGREILKGDDNALGIVQALYQGLQTNSRIEVSYEQGVTGRRILSIDIYYNKKPVRLDFYYHQDSDEVERIETFRQELVFYGGLKELNEFIALLNHPDGKEDYDVYSIKSASRWAVIAFTDGDGNRFKLEYDNYGTLILVLDKHNNDVTRQFRSDPIIPRYGIFASGEAAGTSARLSAHSKSLKALRTAYDLANKEGMDNLASRYLSSAMLAIRDGIRVDEKGEFIAFAKMDPYYGVLSPLDEIDSLFGLAVLAEAYAAWSDIDPVANQYYYLVMHNIAKGKNAGGFGKFEGSEADAETTFSTYLAWLSGPEFPNYWSLPGAIGPMLDFVSHREKMKKADVAAIDFIKQTSSILSSQRDVISQDRFDVLAVEQENQQVLITWKPIPGASLYQIIEERWDEEHARWVITEAAPGIKNQIWTQLSFITMQKSEGGTYRYKVVPWWAPNIARLGPIGGFGFYGSHGDPIISETYNFDVIEKEPSESPVVLAKNVNGLVITMDINGDIEIAQGAKRQIDPQVMGFQLEVYDGPPYDVAKSGKRLPIGVFETRASTINVLTLMEGLRHPDPEQKGKKVELKPNVPYFLQVRSLTGERGTEGTNDFYYLQPFEVNEKQLTRQKGRVSVPSYTSTIANVDLAADGKTATWSGNYPYYRITTWVSSDKLAHHYLQHALVVYWVEGSAENKKELIAPANRIEITGFNAPGAQGLAGDSSGARAIDAMTIPPYHPDILNASQISVDGNRVAFAGEFTENQGIKVEVIDPLKHEVVDVVDVDNLVDYPYFYMSGQKNDDLMRTRQGHVTLKFYIYDKSDLTNRIILPDQYLLVTIKMKNYQSLLMDPNVRLDETKMDYDGHHVYFPLHEDATIYRVVIVNQYGVPIKTVQVVPVGGVGKYPVKGLDLTGSFTVEVYAGRHETDKFAVFNHQPAKRSFTTIQDQAAALDQSLEQDLLDQTKQLIQDGSIQVGLSDRQGIPYTGSNMIHFLDAFQKGAQVYRVYVYDNVGQFVEGYEVFNDRLGTYEKINLDGNKLLKAIEENRGPFQLVFYPGLLNRGQADFTPQGVPWPEPVTFNPSHIQALSEQDISAALKALKPRLSNKLLKIDFRALAMMANAYRLEIWYGGQNNEPGYMIGEQVLHHTYNQHLLSGPQIRKAVQDGQLRFRVYAGKKSPRNELILGDDSTPYREFSAQELGLTNPEVVPVMDSETETNLLDSLRTATVRMTPKKDGVLIPHQLGNRFVKVTAYDKDGLALDSIVVKAQAGQPLELTSAQFVRANVFNPNWGPVTLSLQPSLALSELPFSFDRLNNMKTALLQWDIFTVQSAEYKVGLAAQDRLSSVSRQTPETAKIEQTEEQAGYLFRWQQPTWEELQEWGARTTEDFAGYLVSITLENGQVIERKVPPDITFINVADYVPPGETYSIEVAVRINTVSQGKYSTWSPPIVAVFKEKVKIDPLLDPNQSDAEILTAIKGDRLLDDISPTTRFPLLMSNHDMTHNIPRHAGWGDHILPGGHISTFLFHNGTPIPSGRWERLSKQGKGENPQYLQSRWVTSDHENLVLRNQMMAPDTPIAINTFDWQKLPTGTNRMHLAFTPEQAAIKGKVEIISSGSKDYAVAWFANGQFIAVDRAALNDKGWYLGDQIERAGQDISLAKGEPLSAEQSEGVVFYLNVNENEPTKVFTGVAADSRDVLAYINQAQQFKDNYENLRTNLTAEGPTPANLADLARQIIPNYILPDGTVTDVLFSHLLDKPNSLHWDQRSTSDAAEMALMLWQLRQLYGAMPLADERTIDDYIDSIADRLLRWRSPTGTIYAGQHASMNLFQIPLTGEWTGTNGNTAAFGLNRQFYWGLGKGKATQAAAAIGGIEIGLDNTVLLPNRPERFNFKENRPKQHHPAQSTLEIGRDYSLRQGDVVISEPLTINRLQPGVRQQIEITNNGSKPKTLDFVKTGYVDLASDQNPFANPEEYPGIPSLVRLYIPGSDRAFNADEMLQKKYNEGKTPAQAVREINQELNDIIRDAQASSVVVGGEDRLLALHFGQLKEYESLEFQLGIGNRLNRNVNEWVAVKMVTDYNQLPEADRPTIAPGETHSLRPIYYNVHYTVPQLTDEHSVPVEMHLVKTWEAAIEQEQPADLAGVILDTNQAYPAAGLAYGAISDFYWRKAEESSDPHTKARYQQKARQFGDSALLTAMAAKQIFTTVLFDETITSPQSMTDYYGYHLGLFQWADHYTRSSAGRQAVTRILADPTVASEAKHWFEEMEQQGHWPEQMKKEVMEAVDKVANAVNSVGEPGRYLAYQDILDNHYEQSWRGWSYLIADLLVALQETRENVAQGGANLTETIALHDLKAQGMNMAAISMAAIMAREDGILFPAYQERYNRYLAYLDLAVNKWLRIEGEGEDAGQLYGYRNRLYRTLFSHGRTTRGQLEVMRGLTMARMAFDQQLPRATTLLNQAMDNLFERHDDTTGVTTMTPFGWVHYNHLSAPDLVLDTAAGDQAVGLQMLALMGAQKAGSTVSPDNALTILTKDLKPEPTLADQTPLARTFPNLIDAFWTNLAFFSGVALFLLGGFWARKRMKEHNISKRARQNRPETKINGRPLVEMSVTAFQQFMSAQNPEDILDAWLAQTGGLAFDLSNPGALPQFLHWRQRNQQFSPLHALRILTDQLNGDPSLSAVTQALTNRLQQQVELPQRIRGLRVDPQGVITARNQASRPVVAASYRAAAAWLQHYYQAPAINQALEGLLPKLTGDREIETITLRSAIEPEENEQAEQQISRFEEIVIPDQSTDEAVGQVDSPILRQMRQTLQQVESGRVMQRFWFKWLMGWQQWRIKRWLGKMISAPPFNFRPFTFLPLNPFQQEQSYTTPGKHYTTIMKALERWMKVLMALYESRFGINLKKIEKQIEDLRQQKDQMERRIYTIGDRTKQDPMAVLNLNQEIVLKQMEIEEALRLRDEIRLRIQKQVSQPIMDRVNQLPDDSEWSQTIETTLDKNIAEYEGHLDKLEKNIKAAVPKNRVHKLLSWLGLGNWLQKTNERLKMRQSKGWQANLLAWLTAPPYVALEKNLLGKRAEIIASALLPYLVKQILETENEYLQKIADLQQQIRMARQKDNQAAVSQLESRIAFVEKYLLPKLRMKIREVFLKFVAEEQAVQAKLAATPDPKEIPALEAERDVLKIIIDSFPVLAEGAKPDQQMEDNIERLISQAEPHTNNFTDIQLGDKDYVDDFNLYQLREYLALNNAVGGKVGKINAPANKNGRRAQLIEAAVTLATPVTAFEQGGWLGVKQRRKVLTDMTVLTNWMEKFDLTLPTIANKRQADKKRYQQVEKFTKSRHYHLAMVTGLILSDDYDPAYFTSERGRLEVRGLEPAEIEYFENILMKELGLKADSAGERSTILASTLIRLNDHQKREMIRNILLENDLGKDLFNQQPLSKSALFERNRDIFLSLFPDPAYQEQSRPGIRQAVDYLHRNMSQDLKTLLPDHFIQSLRSFLFTWSVRGLQLGLTIATFYAFGLVYTDPEAYYNLLNALFDYVAIFEFVQQLPATLFEATGSLTGLALMGMVAPDQWQSSKMKWKKVRFSGYAVLLLLIGLYLNAATGVSALGVALFMGHILIGGLLLFHTLWPPAYKIYTLAMLASGKRPKQLDQYSLDELKHEINHYAQEHDGEEMNLLLLKPTFGPDPGVFEEWLNFIKNDVAYLGETLEYLPKLHVTFIAPVNSPAPMQIYQKAALSNFQQYVATNYPEISSQIHFAIFPVSKGWSQKGGQLEDLETFLLELFTSYGTRLKKGLYPGASLPVGAKKFFQVYGDDLIRLVGGPGMIKNQTLNKTINSNQDFMEAIRRGDRVEPVNQQAWHNWIYDPHRLLGNSDDKNSWGLPGRRGVRGSTLLSYLRVMLKNPQIFMALPPIDVNQPMKDSQYLTSPWMHFSKAARTYNTMAEAIIVWVYKHAYGHFGKSMFRIAEHARTMYIGEVNHQQYQTSHDLQEGIGIKKVFAMFGSIISKVRIKVLEPNKSWLFLHRLGDRRHVHRLERDGLSLKLYEHRPHSTTEDKTIDGFVPTLEFKKVLAKALLSVAAQQQWLAVDVKRDVVEDLIWMIDTIAPNNDGSYQVRVKIDEGLGASYQEVAVRFDRDGNVQLSGPLMADQTRQITAKQLNHLLEVILRDGIMSNLEDKGSVGERDMLDPESAVMRDGRWLGGDWMMLLTEGPYANYLSPREVFHFLGLKRRLYLDGVFFAFSLYFVTVALNGWMNLNNIMLAITILIITNIAIIGLDKFILPFLYAWKEHQKVVYEPKNSWEWLKQRVVNTLYFFWLLLQTANFGLRTLLYTTLMALMNLTNMSINVGRVIITGRQGVGVAWGGLSNSELSIFEQKSTFPVFMNQFFEGKLIKARYTSYKRTWIIGLVTAGLFSLAGYIGLILTTTLYIGYGIFVLSWLLGPYVMYLLSQHNAGKWRQQTYSWAFIFFSLLYFSFIGPYFQWEILSQVIFLVYSMVFYLLAIESLPLIPMAWKKGRENSRREKLIQQYRVTHEDDNNTILHKFLLILSDDMIPMVLNDSKLTSTGSLPDVVDKQTLITAHQTLFGADHAQALATRLQNLDEEKYRKLLTGIAKQIEQTRQQQATRSLLRSNFKKARMTLFAVVVIALSVAYKDVLLNEINNIPNRVNNFRADVEKIVNNRLPDIWLYRYLTEPRPERVIEEPKPGWQVPLLEQKQESKAPDTEESARTDKQDETVPAVVQEMKKHKPWFNEPLEQRPGLKKMLLAAHTIGLSALLFPSVAAAQTTIGYLQTDYTGLALAIITVFGIALVKLLINIFLKSGPAFKLNPDHQIMLQQLVGVDAKGAGLTFETVSNYEGQHSVMAQLMRGTPNGRYVEKPGETATLVIADSLAAILIGFITSDKQTAFDQLKYRFARQVLMRLLDRAMLEWIKPTRLEMDNHQQQREGMTIIEKALDTIATPLRHSLVPFVLGQSVLVFAVASTLAVALATVVLATLAGLPVLFVTILLSSMAGVAAWLFASVTHRRYDYQDHSRKEITLSREVLDLSRSNEKKYSQLGTEVAIDPLDLLMTVINANEAVQSSLGQATGDRHTVQKMVENLQSMTKAGHGISLGTIINQLRTEQVVPNTWLDVLQTLTREAQTRNGTTPATYENAALAVLLKKDQRTINTTIAKREAALSGETRLYLLNAPELIAKLQQITAANYELAQQYNLTGQVMERFAELNQALTALDTLTKESDYGELLNLNQQPGLTARLLPYLQASAAALQTEQIVELGQDFDRSEKISVATGTHRVHQLEQADGSTIAMPVQDVHELTGYRVVGQQSNWQVWLQSGAVTAKNYFMTRQAINVTPAGGAWLAAFLMQIGTGMLRNTFIDVAARQAALAVNAPTYVTSYAKQQKYQSTLRQIIEDENSSVHEVLRRRDYTSNEMQKALIITLIRVLMNNRDDEQLAVEIIDLMNHIAVGNTVVAGKWQGRVFSLPQLLWTPGMRGKFGFMKDYLENLTYVELDAEMEKVIQRRIIRSAASSA